MTQPTALDNLVSAQFEAHAAHQAGKHARIVLVPNIHLDPKTGEQATGCTFQVETR